MAHYAQKLLRRHELTIRIHAPLFATCRCRWCCLVGLGKMVNHLTKSQIPLNHSLNREASPLSPSTSNLPWETASETAKRPDMMRTRVPA